MSIYLPDLKQCGDFPSVDQALSEPDGLLCMGGDLSKQRLITAYQQGIFPWYGDDEPILWWSPTYRMVLPPEEIHISRSLAKAYNKYQPQFFINRNFKAVIENCAFINRNTPGRWIHNEMIDAYLALFDSGHAFCIEVEIDGQLAGGLYGVKTRHVYSGESMFSLQKNGSKYAMLALCAYLETKGITFLDCQLYNPHLATMGARLIPRNHFINQL
ncbi:MAG: leucyl/phenylalanyl-tRNA--protein transferase [Proteobacteria bacterium]|nr:MAG: leucyl/phenylalanyl-tRNA--protein transferase [Pseudomonadota bacterium]